VSGSSLRTRAIVVMPPVVVGAAFLGAWEALVRVRHLKPFLLPRPSAIWSAGLDNLELMRRATLVSGTNALIGLLAGTVGGAVLAALTNRFRGVSDVLTPITIAINAIPIVVLVSIFSKMFEQTSEVPRRLMAALVTFFVVFVNVTRGLRQSSPTQLELMRSYAASPRQQFWKVRLPNASPFLFTGVRIAAPLAVITAFVAEYFGGNQNGLGFKITSAMSSSKNELGWAYVGAACLLGLTFFVAATVLELVAVPWQRQRVSK
jgi:NitT/TauT family transport system permease protein